jgi:light-regulated signal transduction histidine kinase (bacteriophytochrome)
MSYCVLRSVSPIHLQYLRNIGSQASMSLSLIEGNRLWGLIACHHQKPKQISHEARIACEFLAHSVSLQIRSKEDEENQDYALKLRENVRRIAGFLAADAEFQDGLLKHRPDVMSLFRAGGAAVVTGSQLHLRGLTPDPDAVRALLTWLKQQVFNQGLWCTDRLSDAWPEAAAFRERASGLLAVRVEEAELQWLLWFRPEIVQMVNWAGDPRKPAEVDLASGLATLSPRRSFELWQEEKRGVSEPWLAEELRVAGELRQLVVEVALKRSRRLKRENENLSRSNDELESFAYAAGHDLKEPLRGIQTYADMLLRSTGERLSDKEREAMAMVLRLARRMDELIDSLLEYSRAGRLELELEEIDTNEVVNEALQMLKHQLQPQGVEVRRPRPLPPVTGDRVRLLEVLQNLITNAVKYNDKPGKWVEIGYQDGPPLTLYVRDNGIGIAERHHASVFRIFNRLHGRDAFGGGTGIGLTIVQKVIDRHGGRIWLESTPDEGSTFYFTLGTR